MSVKEHINYQWRLWLVALSFFTRIKTPAIENFDQRWLNQASRYYGLVGLLIGAISSIILYLSAQLLPLNIAIVLAMITSVVVTGGFHEDGLADTWDGFGGGWTVEQKLTIMKDSRLGTYGALSLFFGLFLKYQLLIELTNVNAGMSAVTNVVIALLVAHCVSRAMAVSIIFDQPYVRDIDSSKIKPMTEQQSSVELVTLLLSSLLPLFMLPMPLAVILAGTLWLLRYFLISWYRKQLGGYTGDLLGAAQQIAELCCYIVLLAYWF